MVVMDIVFRVLLCTFTVLNLFAALILPVPGYAGEMYKLYQDKSGMLNFT